MAEATTAEGASSDHAHRMVLVDEDLDPRLAPTLAAELGDTFRCSSVRGEGWLNLRNGELIAAMRAAGFDVLVTADRNLQYQQPLARLGIAVVVVRDPKTALARVPTIAAAVRVAVPGEAIEVPAPATEQT